MHVSTMLGVVQRMSSSRLRIAGQAALAGVHVVILTTFELDEYIFDGLRAGAAAQDRSG